MAIELKHKNQLQQNYEHSWMVSFLVVALL
jgi:hypothetical protein